MSGRGGEQVWAVIERSFSLSLNLKLSYSKWV
jgi:hypothetical protein